MPEKKNDTKWALPHFYFKVKLGSLETSFQEVSGLETESHITEYGHGDSKQFSTINKPGATKTGNVTLKKGVFSKDNNFFEWYNAFKKNTVKRGTVIIELMDEEGNPTMAWTLTNAWPTKITRTELESDLNEAAVETLELTHEGITIEDGEYF